MFRPKKNFSSSFHLISLFISSSLHLTNFRWHQIWLDTFSDPKNIFFICSSLHLTLHLFISLISDNTRFGLDTCSDPKKNFLHLFISSSPLISDNTRFGLIHVRTQKKFFFICSFLHLTLHLFISLISDNTRFGLIHVWTKKKISLSVHLFISLFISLISDNTRFGLIHVWTQKKFSSSVHLTLHLTNFR